MAAPSLEGSEFDRRFRPCRKGPPLFTIDARPCGRTPVPRPHRHFERSRPTLFLSTLLVQSGRPAKREISLLFRAPRPACPVYPEPRRAPPAPRASPPIRHFERASRRFSAHPPQPSFRTQKPTLFCPPPNPSFRTEQADVFSFHFAPAKWSACAERNLSAAFCTMNSLFRASRLRRFRTAHFLSLSSRLPCCPVYLVCPELRGGSRRATALHSRSSAMCAEGLPPAIHLCGRAMQPRSWKARKLARWASPCTDSCTE
jgi:hypothetical protein